MHNDLSYVEWRTTEIRSFERECNDPRDLALIIDGFLNAFRRELEEMQALKAWAAEESEKWGVPVEGILKEAGSHYHGIVRKSNFLSNRRKEMESAGARRRGDTPSLLTDPLSEDKDIRIFQEPEYMAMLNEDLSDASNFFSKQAKRAARMNREKLDRSIAAIKQAEQQSVALRRNR